MKGLHGAKRRGRPQRRPAQRVRPQLQRLLDQLTDSPALVLGRHMDILAWNSLAASLITDFSALPPGERNYLRLAFVDPHVRGLFADWETTARTCVAYLRMDALQYPDDPRLATLVGELSVRDPDFRQWWAAHDVAHKTCGTKKLNHPVAGELTLDWEILGCATDPDQQLMVMTAVPGSAAQESLRFLASWTGPDNSPPRNPAHPRPTGPVKHTAALRVAAARPHPVRPMKSAAAGPDLISGRLSWRRLRRMRQGCGTGSTCEGARAGPLPMLPPSTPAPVRPRGRRGRMTSGQQHGRW